MNELDNDNKLYVEKPETVHGRLLESVHVSGYSLERAVENFQWLLDKDRWKTVGPGYENIDDFVKTISFEGFKISIEQRKKIAKQLNDLRATQRAAAQVLGVTHTTVQRDLNDGTNVPKPKPEPLPMVDKTKPVVTNVPDQPPAIITQSGEEAAKTLAKIEDSKTKKESQKQKHDEKRTKPLPEKIYRVIYSDPPWSFDNSGVNIAAEKQYPTMSLKEICDLKIKDLCDSTSILFLWAVASQIPEAISVSKSWGFPEIKTCFVWIKNKDSFGGWWIKTRHEILLLCTKPDSPQPKEKIDSVIESPVGIHSKKPEVVYEIIEKMYPAPYIELFARNSRTGWDSWGNE